jgi:hypothetical protein
VLAAFADAGEEDLAGVAFAVVDRDPARGRHVVQVYEGGLLWFPTHCA